MPIITGDSHRQRVVGHCWEIVGLVPVGFDRSRENHAPGTRPERRTRFFVVNFPRVTTFEWDGWRRGIGGIFFFEVNAMNKALFKKIQHQFGLLSFTVHAIIGQTPEYTRTQIQCRRGSAVYLRNLSRVMGRLGVMVDIENVFRQEIYSTLFRLSGN